MDDKPPKYLLKPDGNPPHHRGMADSQDDSLQMLREAVRQSPDNVPLRLHLAETLLTRGQAEEAAKEFSHALTLAPDHARLKLGLASAFYQQSKNGQALVIVEDLLKDPKASASSYGKSSTINSSTASLTNAISRSKTFTRYKKVLFTI